MLRVLHHRMDTSLTTPRHPSTWVTTTRMDHHNLHHHLTRFVQVAFFFDGPPPSHLLPSHVTYTYWDYTLLTGPHSAHTAHTTQLTLATWTPLVLLPLWHCCTPLLGWVYCPGSGWFKFWFTLPFLHWVGFTAPLALLWFTHPH